MLSDVAPPSCSYKLGDTEVNLDSRQWQFSLIKAGDKTIFLSLTLASSRWIGEFSLRSIVFFPPSASFLNYNCLSLSNFFFFFSKNRFVWVYDVRMCGAYVEVSWQYYRDSLLLSSLHGFQRINSDSKTVCHVSSSSEPFYLPSLIRYLEDLAVMYLS